MAQPKVITLEDPIENEAGETITEIELRPPTLKDRQLLDSLDLNGNAEGSMEFRNWASIAFMAAKRLGNLAPATAEKLSAGDAMNIYTEVMLFIGGSRTTGLMQSPS